VAIKHTAKRAAASNIAKEEAFFARFASDAKKKARAEEEAFFAFFARLAQIKAKNDDKT
jgi:hypothetical protein